jgi:pyrroloquinoline quinone (PQQ) biosynthesis protein C
MIYFGTSQAFVDSLCLEAKNHCVLRHKYFDKFSKLSISEADNALRDFIFQYSFYSRRFDDYNSAVLSTVNAPEYRSVILGNISDEQGSGDPGFAGLPHRIMYTRFAERIGIDQAFRDKTSPVATAKIWSDLFLQKCSSAIPGVGLAAISIGTEYIVPDIYKHILRLIDRSSFSQIEEKYFFVLHSQCDEEHSRQLIELLYNFCENNEHREAVRFGAISALNLRAAFFDVMAARLENMLCNQNMMTQKVFTTELQPSGVEIHHAACPT